MASGRVLATQEARDAAKQLLELTGSVKERVGRVLQQGGVLADAHRWDGGLAGKWRNQWGQDASQLKQAATKLDKLERRAQQVVKDIFKADSGPPVAAALTSESVGVKDDVIDQKTKDMLAYFRQNVHDDGVFGNSLSLESIDQRLAQLTPAERAAFLSQLTPAELQDWNRQISRGGGWPWQSEGLTTSDRVQLANLLLGSADPGALASLQANMPALQPDAHNKEETPAGWTSTSDQPLFGPDGKPVVDDINQGYDGDCWLLAGLGAVAMKDPALIQQNIHQNDNGTYTVTFYRNGQAVPVTVTDSVPGTSTVGDYAHPNPGDNAKWVQLYEKAYAQLNGGYGPIEGGFGDTAMSDITGQPATREAVNPVAIPGPDGVPPLLPSGPSLSDISSKLNSGYAITTGSSDGKAWPWSSEPNRLDGGLVVPSHEYMVQSVDTSAHPPTITLRNPWGKHGAAPDTVTLTEYQWQQYFTEVSSAQMK